MHIMRNIIFFTILIQYIFAGTDYTAGVTRLFEKEKHELSSRYSYLKDMRIGLIINHTSKYPGPSYLPTTYQLFKENGLNVVRIFSPEHGLSGRYAAGENVPSTSEVVSLYGKNKDPQDYHLQDIGVRYYTYISTMTLAMEKAAQNNIKFMVLDRVNPLGRVVEGSVLNVEFSSFVGMHPVPVRHGLTIGEMALFIKQNNLIDSADKLSLEIVEGWNWDGGYSRGNKCSPDFYRTSPNIPHLENALMYVGTCLLEGTNVSEGRGVEPFLSFGAPWLDSDKIIKALEKYKFRNVNFESHKKIPYKSKYKDVECNFILINLKQNLSRSADAIDEIEPFKIGISIINEIYKAHPDDFQFKDDFFDKLYGSSDLRLAILKSEDLNELMVRNEEDIKEYLKLAEKAKLYN